MEVRASIRAFIDDNLLFNNGEFTYFDDDSFLREGIVDSLGVMELVAFVNQSLGISVAPQEVTPENFDSVNKLAAYVARKQGVAARVGDEPRLEVA